MRLNQTFPSAPQPTSWLKSLQVKINRWIRQEIIDEDPCDEEQFEAQRLYDQFQSLDQVAKIQSHARSHHSASC